MLVHDTLRYDEGPCRLMINVKTVAYFVIIPQYRMEDGLMMSQLLWSSAHKS